MNAIAIAGLVFGLGAAISMGIAGVIQLLFLGLQAARRRSAAAAPKTDPDMPVLEAGEGGVLS